jgi:arylformamidase
MKKVSWTGNESDYDLIDLTHVLRHGIPFWPTHPRFKMEQVSSLEEGKESSYHSVCLSEHTGTHFDAPSHFILGAATITDIPIQKFFGRLAKINVVGQEPNSQLPTSKIVDFEKQNGMLEAGDAVMFYFGWSQHWEQPAEFLQGWPGLSPEAASLLVERGIRIAGTDCLSIDHFTSKTFPAHNILLGANILIGENFANLGRLPPWSFLTALPLPIENGTGSPVRAIAFVERG